MSDFVGVTLKELDYSTSVQSVAVTGAGFVAGYAWGPVEKPLTITTLDNYAITFGKPVASNKVPYLTGASYLDYADSLRAVRVVGEGSKNATSIKYDYAKLVLKDVVGEITVGDSVSTNGGTISAEVVNYDAETKTLAIRKCTGLFDVDYEIEFGNTANAVIASIAAPQYAKIQISEVSGEFVADENITNSNGTASGLVVEVLEDSIIYKVISGEFEVSDVITGSESEATATVSVKPAYIDNGEGGILIKNQDIFETMVVPYKFAARYAGDLGNSIKVSVANAQSFANWEYASLFDGAPEGDEIHIVVVDTKGVFYNSFAGNILSRYEYLSITEGAKDEQGEDIYYRKVLNNRDGYVYVGSDDLEPIDYVDGIQLGAGVYVEPQDDELVAGYNLFSDQENETSLYVFGANYSTAVVNSTIAMIEKRQDIMGIFSPSSLSLLQHSNINDTVEALIAWGNGITMSNRVFLDSNWMYYYNRFDNEYVWIPMAGATAGVNARCDTLNNPWDSPMGFTRGTYNNVTQLAWQPDKEARIAIYARSINPIYVSNQAGVVLMGDRTHVIKQSYFRQMAARKTLIIIERGAVAYLMFYLGENNNRQTRQLVTSNLEAWLRGLGAAGAFRLAQVVCNESNNTQQVIDEQKMRVLIRLLLQSSINTIELQVAVVNNVAVFTENVIQGVF